MYNARNCKFRSPCPWKRSRAQLLPLEAQPLPLEQNELARPPARAHEAWAPEGVYAALALGVFPAPNNWVSDKVR